MYRVLILLSLAVFVVTPMADQLACTFCGPSAETTATAKPVPHTEDDCILKDGFERAPQEPDEEPVHIHFCLIHATSVALTTVGVLDFSPDVGDFESSRLIVESSYSPSFFHPPTAV